MSPSGRDVELQLPVPGLVPGTHVFDARNARNKNHEGTEGTETAMRCILFVFSVPPW